MPADRPLFKRFVIDPALAIAALVVYGVFRVMRFRAASALGGALARTIGPHLTIHRRAISNLKAAFPEKSEAEIAAIARGMWDNLGRVAGEYPHLDKIDTLNSAGYVEVVGSKYIKLLRDDNKPGIFFSGHIANWEIAPQTAVQRGVPIDRVYRAANNPLMDWLYERRLSGNEGKLIPKGAEGARNLLRAIKDGRHIAILVDQKMNDGIAIPFFGRDAMTAPALAELVLRYECPVVPARVERIKGARLRLTVEPPLQFTPSGNRHADVKAIMTLVNEKLESWIRDTPEQWLWLHNRWPE